MGTGEPAIVCGRLSHGRPRGKQLDDVRLDVVAITPMSERVGWQRNIEKNARSACAACTGMCCTAFTVRNVPSEEKIAELIADIDLKIKKVEDRIDQVRMVAAMRGAVKIPQLKEEVEKIAALTQQRNDTAFLVNLIEIAEVNGNKIYRCSKFSLEKQRCTIYPDRPTMCRNYLCGHAARFGSPPPKQIMFAGNKALDHIIPKMAAKGRNRMKSILSWTKERPNPEAIYLDQATKCEEVADERFLAEEISKELLLGTPVSSVSLDNAIQIALPDASKKERKAILKLINEKALKLQDREPVHIQTEKVNSRGSRGKRLHRAR